MGREPVAVRSRISGKVRGLDKQDEDTWPHSHACVNLPRLRRFIMLFLKRTQDGGGPWND
jgi:hypothetical protein